MDQNRSKQLQESEERFRKVFEEGPLGVVLLGLDARIQRCNCRFCEMLDYSEEEIIALGLDGISHPEDWETDRQLGSRLLRDEIPNYTIEKRYVRKGGVVFWGQLTVSMMHDAEGEPTTVIGMVEDISERKRAEAGLSNSERMLRTLMDASPEAIVLVDTEETVLIANETAARRFGITVDKMIGQGIHTFVPPEVAAQRVKHLQEVIRTGKGVRFEDQRSGSHFEIAMHPVFDDQGKVTAIALLGIDLTDRKRAEQALKQAHDELERRVEERTAELTEANKELAVFRRFAEASGEGFGMSELDGRIAYVNATLCRLFGEATPQDVIGKHVSTYYPEEYVSKRQSEMLPALLRGGGFWHVEQTVLPRHGEPIQTVQSTFLIRDESGEPFRIAVVISDITERKRAEKALRQAHDELRAIYDGIIEGLLLTDIETKRFVRVNSSLCRMLGYSEEELLAKSISDIHPSEEVPEDLRRFQDIAEDRASVQQDRPVLRKDGSIFCADITGHRIVYEGRPCLLAVFHDVTERKRAEEALRQSEEKHRGLLAACPDGVIMTDLIGRVLFASQRTWELVGLSDREELVGKSVYDFVIEGKPGQLAASYSNLIATGVRRNTEYAIRRQDGTTVPTEVSSALNRDAQGRPIAVMGVIRDITERKRAEEMLEREHRTLKHLLQSSDHERQTIAYEIHDGLAQQLAGAIMQFQTYHHQKETNPKLAAKAYDAGLTMLQQGHFEARRLIAGVRPPILDESGVVAAVGHLVNEQSRQKGPKIEYRSSVDFDRLAPIAENAIYPERFRVSEFPTEQQLAAMGATRL